jgi:hypothetical protein
LYRKVLLSPVCRVVGRSEAARLAEDASTLILFPSALISSTRISPCLVWRADSRSRLINMSETCSGVMWTLSAKAGETEKSLEDVLRGRASWVAGAVRGATLWMREDGRYG